jgi:hypothetical protein
MKPPGLQSLFYRSAAESEAKQLLSRHDIVLTPRQIPRLVRPIRLPFRRLLNFPPHTVEKSATAWTRPPYPASFGELAAPKPSRGRR